MSVWKVKMRKGEEKGKTGDAKSMEVYYIKEVA